jgi:hypothetical protein
VPFSLVVGILADTEGAQEFDPFDLVADNPSFFQPAICYVNFVFLECVDDGATLWFYCPYYPLQFSLFVGTDDGCSQIELKALFDMLEILELEFIIGIYISAMHPAIRLEVLQATRARKTET